MKLPVGAFKLDLSEDGNVAFLEGEAEFHKTSEIRGSSKVPLPVA